LEKRSKHWVAKRLLSGLVRTAVNIGFTGDISLTGVFIKTNTMFAPGSILKLEIELPDSKMLHLKGTVMGQESPGHPGAPYKEKGWG
jgi:hypothetical protein